MGTRNTQPPAQEGSPPSHRQAADQVRRRLTGGAASGFRARPVSLGVSTFRKSFKRGGEFAPRTSMSACSRPLCRVRGSGSSCHAINTPQSTATASSDGFANWSAFACFRRFTPAHHTISPFGPAAKRTPPGSTVSRQTSPRSLADSRRRRPASRPWAETDAARSGLVRARLPGGDLTVAAGVVPLLSNLLSVRHRGHRAVRSDARGMDGGAPHRPVSSIPSGRVRPGSIATRPPGPLHG